jgi:hypothetical protein
MSKKSTKKVAIQPTVDQMTSVLSVFSSKRNPAPTAQAIVDVLTRSRKRETLSIEIITVILQSLVEQGSIISIRGFRGDERYILVQKLSSRRGWYSNPKTLLMMIHPEYITRVFESIARRLAQDGVISNTMSNLGETAEEVGIPEALTYQIVRIGLAAHVLEITDSQDMRYTKRMSATQLTHGYVMSKLLATEQLALRVEGKQLSDERNPLVRLIHLQKSQRDEAIMPTVTIKSLNGTPRLLALGEVLLGHKMSDAGYTLQLIQWLESLPESEKPDVIALSGLLLGEFKFTQKAMRPVLVQGFDKLGDQIALAFELLSRLQNACPNATILVNTDKYFTGIVTSLTYQALFNLRRKQDDSPKQWDNAMLANFKQLDRLHEQVEEWDFHYMFNYLVVLPFLIRSGRGLRNEVQMESETGLLVDEYSLLLDLYQQMISGRKPEPVAGIDIDYLPLFTRIRKTYPLFTIIDNARVRLVAGKRAIDIDVFNQMTLTEATIPGDPLTIPARIYGQTDNLHHDQPNAVIMLGGHVPTSLVGNNVWLLSPSSPLASGDSYRVQRRYGNISANPAHRLAYSTRILTEAGSNQFSWYPDGSRSVTFLTRKWIERSDVCPERKYVVWIGDLQTGSPTGLLDVYVQALSYVFNYLVLEGEIYLVFGGDLVQGRNYPAFVTESPGIPLARIEDQMATVEWMTRKSLAQIPDANLKSLRGVAAVPGNHEWNYAAGYGNLGALFTDYILRLFRELRDWKGYDMDISRYSHTVRSQANAFQHWMVTVDDFIPDVRLGFQHLPMERMKGAPGPGRSVMQYRALVEGVSMFLKSFDIFGTGHWHNPQHLMLGDTVGIIHPALAGVSGYEVVRAMGVSPISQGISVMGFGGGRPFEWRVMTTEALSKYPVKGYFSDTGLKQQGFQADDGWNRKLHGMNCLPGDPQSAIQKSIRAEMFNIVYGSGEHARVVDLGKKPQSARAQMQNQ